MKYWLYLHEWLKFCCKSTWRIIPVSKWLVTPIYKPWSSAIWKRSQNSIRVPGTFQRSPWFRDFPHEPTPAITSPTASFDFTHRFTHRIQRRRLVTAIHRRLNWLGCFPNRLWIWRVLPFGTRNLYLGHLVTVEHDRYVGICLIFFFWKKFKKGRGMWMWFFFWGVVGKWHFWGEDVGFILCYIYIYTCLVWTGFGWVGWLSEPWLVDVWTSSRRISTSCWGRSILLSKTQNMWPFSAGHQQWSLYTPCNLDPENLPSQTHRIHGTGIFTYIWLISYGKCR